MHISYKKKLFSKIFLTNIELRNIIKLYKYLRQIYKKIFIKYSNFVNRKGGIKMKKNSSKKIIICLLGILVMTYFFGCLPERQEKIKLVWGVDELNQVHNVQYFNRLLEEKGYPYELEIKLIPLDYCAGIDKCKAENEQIDLLYSGVFQNTENYFPQLYFVNKGYCLPLEKYLDTDAGKMLTETYPETVLEHAKINGFLYGLPNLNINPVKKILYWNREYAEKYQLDMSVLQQDILQLEKYADIVSEGERKNENFLVSSSMDFNLWTRGYEMLLSLPYVSIVETEDGWQVVPRFESEDFREINAMLTRFYQKGYFRYPANPSQYDFFFGLTTALSEEEFDEVYNSDNKYDSMVYDAISLTYQWAFEQNSITTWSEHPDEAFDLLAAVMTDPELCNALVWGEKGVEYTLSEGRCYKAGTIGESARDAWAFRNKLISYPLPYEPLDRQLIRDAIENMEISDLNGFLFDTEPVKNEILATSQFYYSFQNSVYEDGGSALAYVEDVDAFNQQLREAGLQKIIDEANRQLKEWAEK